MYVRMYVPNANVVVPGVPEIQGPESHQIQIDDKCIHKQSQFQQNLVLLALV